MGSQSVDRIFTACILITKNAQFLHADNKDSALLLYVRGRVYKFSEISGTFLTLPHTCFKGSITSDSCLEHVWPYKKKIIHICAFIVFLF